MEGKFPIRSRKDAEPLLLKLGFALALSIAGYFASNFLFRPRPPPPDGGSKKNGAKSTRVRAGGLRDELRVLSSEEELAKIVNGTSNICTNSVVIDEFRTPSCEEELVKIVNGTSNSRTTATTKVIEEEGEEFAAYPESKAMNYEWEKEKLELEQEIGYLRNLVEALKERERTLEVQLLEYYGLEEQEATLRELENRVKVNAMESKLLYLKIDSLQAENQKLQAQVSELESAREEIKVLRGKLRLEGEETKEKLAPLHQRIRKLQERILKDGETDAQVDRKEDETMEDHQTVNLKLVQQSESTKMAASSNFEVEAGHLREENETLKKEIELRNYQPPPPPPPAPGKTVAKDLGKSLSPRSEQKAKQLILEYAHSEINVRSTNLFNIDADSCPSSSSSSCEECIDTSIDLSSSTKNSKSKFLSKLRKLVLGNESQRSKDKLHGTPTSRGSSSRRASISPCSVGGSNGVRTPFDSSPSCVSVENATPNHTGMDSHANEQWLGNIAQSQKVSMFSLDVERIRRLDVGVGRIDIGMSGGHMRMISEEDDCSSGSFQNQDDSDAPEKVKLKKLAQVFKGSRGLQKQKRRTVSFSYN